MALSKLRTHPGRSSKNDDRLTTAGLLQRGPTADEPRRSSYSIQSVRPSGGGVTFVADNCLKLHVQPPSLPRAAAPEFIISGSETENKPPDARKVNLDMARHNHRGFYEL